MWIYDRPWRVQDGGLVDGPFLGSVPVPGSVWVYWECPDSFDFHEWRQDERAAAEIDFADELAASAEDFADDCVVNDYLMAMMAHLRVPSRKTLERAWQLHASMRPDLQAAAAAHMQFI